MDIYKLQLQFETTIEYKQLLIDVLFTDKEHYQLYEEVFTKWLDRNGHMIK